MTDPPSAARLSSKHNNRRAANARCGRAGFDRDGFGGRNEGLLVNEEELERRLVTLKVEHRDLDAAIAALNSTGSDQLQVARLKRRKLQLRDQIAIIEDYLTPDIIA
jgi:hypothetical protein